MNKTFTTKAKNASCSVIPGWIPSQRPSQMSLADPRNRLADPSLPRLVQTKLTVNEPGDKYEQEADRVAEEIMHAPGFSGSAMPAGDPPNIQKKCAACASGKGLCPKCAKEEEENLQLKPLSSRISPVIQRQTADPSEDEDEYDLILRKEASSDFLGNSVALAAHVKSQTNRGVQSLPNSERYFFESRFGFGFSRINIFPPEPVTIQTKLMINQPGDKYEQEADRVEEVVMRMPETVVKRKPT